MLVDLLIRNARILTQDSEQPVAESLLIHDGKVLALDVDQQSVLRARKVVDAAGAVIVPGFNDVHAHSVWFGLGLMEANLGSVASLDDAYDGDSRSRCVAGGGRVGGGLGVQPAAA